MADWWERIPVTVTPITVSAINTPSMKIFLRAGDILWLRGCFQKGRGMCCEMGRCKGAANWGNFKAIIGMRFLKLTSMETCALECLDLATRVFHVFFGGDLTLQRKESGSRFKPLDDMRPIRDSVSWHRMLVFLSVIIMQVNSCCVCYRICYILNIKFFSMEKLPFA